MSDEENPGTDSATKESSEAKPTEAKEAIPEQAAAKETVTEEPAAKESALKAVANITAMLMQLKEDNPKVLYGGIGGIVLIVLFMMMSGGGPSEAVKQSVQGLQVGQQYILKSANSYEPDSTVRLVATPGSTAAYDDTEKADREGCKHLAQGTKVTLKQFFGAYGNPKAFAKVSPLSGECKGSVGWTSTNNLKQR